MKKLSLSMLCGIIIASILCTNAFAYEVSTEEARVNDNQVVFSASAEYYFDEEAAVDSIVFGDETIVPSLQGSGASEEEGTYITERYASKEKHYFYEYILDYKARDNGNGLYNFSYVYVTVKAYPNNSDYPGDLWYISLKVEKPTIEFSGSREQSSRYATVNVKINCEVTAITTTQWGETHSRKFDINDLI